MTLASRGGARDHPDTAPPRPHFPHLGATYDGLGTNFSVYSQVAEQVELCLFDDDGKEERHPLTEVDAYCWHGYLEGALQGNNTATARTTSCPGTTGRARAAESGVLARAAESGVMARAAESGVLASTPTPPCPTPTCMATR